MTIWRMRTACWIGMATDTHSEQVTVITLPQQKWLRQTHLNVKFVDSS